MLFLLPAIVDDDGFESVFSKDLLVLHGLSSPLGLSPPSRHDAKGQRPMVQFSDTFCCFHKTVIKTAIARCRLNV